MEQFLIRVREVLTSAVGMCMGTQCKLPYSNSTLKYLKVTMHSTTMPLLEDTIQCSFKERNAVFFTKYVFKAAAKVKHGWMQHLATV